MAKVTGPLFSMDASGGFGGALVFGKWKGRNVVRQLVTPANPQTEDQEDARNRVRVVGAGQRFANLTTEKGAGRSITDKEALTALAPSGQAWNGFLSKSMIGAGALNYAAATSAYAGLTTEQKEDWDEAAAELSPVFPDVYQTEEFGEAGTPMAAGEAFFHYQYGLYIAGVATVVPGAVPPTYA
jgi:hypothetical protein